jgi:NAD(P)H-hydrate epimerase
MREADRRTVEAGIPNLVLMENAGHRVVEFLERRFSPISLQRIVIICGKGNNGGDGLVIARQLYTRFRPLSLDVVLAIDPPHPQLELLRATGCPVEKEILPQMRAATLVIDALLGTGLNGAPKEPYAAIIQEINQGFPLAKVVAVDIPSGLNSDAAETAWCHVRAHATVTFTSPQPAHVLEPNASAAGELVVAPIGTAPVLCESQLVLGERADFAPLLQPRSRTAHKGDFGHVLVIGGSRGKTGAAAMTGMAALRAGAGLVTVCSAEPPPFVELMWEPLEDWASIERAAEGKTVLAVGPGLGHAAEVDRIVANLPQPIVLDADGLNQLAAGRIPMGDRFVLTPHPGEMSRLMKRPTAEIQRNRVEVARQFATAHNVTLVLKGANTLTAFGDGEVWVNPTGGPEMATGGSGDVLTGMIAGLLAQFPDQQRLVVPGAVWLHGRAGDLAAGELGEKSVIATDLLKYLPWAMEECGRRVSH